MSLKPESNPDDPLTTLMNFAKTVFQCDLESIHGQRHWLRVDKTATELCRHTGVDLTVARCFAYLHDSCRQDDGGDSRHGIRAAERLPDFRMQVPFLETLNLRQFELLRYAIRHHVDGKVSDDPTVGTCWDADRLDLGRVGITPDPKYMSTKRGKELARG